VQADTVLAPSQQPANKCGTSALTRKPERLHDRDRATPSDRGFLGGGDKNDEI